MQQGGRALSNVEWLLREAMDDHSFQIGERAVMEDERWRGTIQRLDIGAGLRVSLTDAEARQDITIEARDNRTDRWIGSQVTIEGAAHIDFLDGQRMSVTADRALLFRPSGRRAAFTLAAGTRFRSAGYGLEVERIRRLFDDKVPQVLQALVEHDIDSSRILAMHAVRPMRQLAAGLFGQRLNGPLRTLMMEGLVLQLLAVQTATATEECQSKSTQALSPSERQAICDARARLFADMRNPPSLGQLAMAVGLSERRLNAGFRILFGMTVFEALKNERLEHARLAFEAGNLPLKEAAFRVGYNHVSNFVSAFKARYGAPPRQYLERKRERS